MGRILSLLLLFVILAATIVSAADESAGSLRKKKGDVFIERQGNILRAEDGASVYPSDTVGTGANSAVGIVFKDDSRISLGSNSRLELKQFVFEPALRQFSMVNKLIKGTASCISGKMTKLSPESVILETPSATIGVRGTTYHVKVSED